MIFNNAEATALYRMYLITGDKMYVDRLCELSTSLVEVIALSANPEHADDLAQEGYIKLHSLITRRGFDPERGSTLFSFLSTSLRNCMIDYLRKERCTSELDESLICADSPTESTLLDLYSISAYAKGRFPSLHPTVAADAAEYIATSLVECKAKGVLKTLDLVYGFNKSLAYTFYHSIIIYTRMVILGRVPQEPVCSVIEDREMTLLPELCIILGLDTANLLAKIMGGSYVRF